MWSDWLVFCDCDFQSVCPLMEKDKRLMEASWWDRLTEGETGSWELDYKESWVLKNWCFRTVVLEKTPLDCKDIRELDYKESWVLKNWCFRTMVLEKTPLDCKDIQPVHPKGNQSWIFIGRTDGKAETAILWLPDVKSWLIWKDTDVGKDWRQEEKGMTEDDMVWWHHQLDGYEFEQALGFGSGQGSLVHCNSWGCKESDRTERLNLLTEVIMVRLFMIGLVPL